MKLTPAQLGLTPYEHAITLLMSRPKLNWKWKLEPEQKECVNFADELRKQTANGNLRSVWCHVANEGKRNRITGCILKAMGLIPGSYDYWFLWDNGGGVIEMKIKPNKPSENQEYFGLWCERRRVRKAVCYSKEEALSVLKIWGALT